MASQRALHLYNTYTKLMHPVLIAGIPVQVSNNYRRLQGNLYICGPTVYDNCHVGHALTYIRADLFRRFMRNYLNLDLTTVMNITDVDDKIIERANSQGIHYKKLSDKFYSQFLSDLDLIRVQPADLFLRITDNMNVITDYIRILESTGHAYQSSNGDINFDVTSLINYTGQTGNRTNLSQMKKKDPRDFVLWKKSKPNEPVWNYVNSKGETLSGRPGWHVQCSALASSIFGNSLDFHFGGKDLIFPHHYNETACCCAYHGLDVNQPIHEWCNHWLHSGHLVISDEKMSKSLGNVVSIKDFIGRSSVNSLRLLCIVNHYSNDLRYDEELVTKLGKLDHKLNSFSEFLRNSLKQHEKQTEKIDRSTKLILAVNETSHKILDGICDGFSLSLGLNAIIDLSKSYYSESENRHLSVQEIKSAQVLLTQWFNSCGLDYGLDGSQQQNMETSSLVESLSTFRNRVRDLSLASLRDKENPNLAKSVLQECDRVREELDLLGIVVRDSKSRNL